MLNKLVGVYIIIAILQHVRGTEDTIETSCTINGKKAIQCVSEKFLSISIDPAVLLAGVNLSEKSLRLAQHLSPAYIRIAGPSTSFVKYVDKDDRFANYLSEDGNNVIVTPSMWFGINEWFKLANLMPVFGINDADTDSGNWNPKETLPLLEISDKLNVSCYWQLGFDSTNKTEMRYEQDLNILHDILAAFPERNATWKIVGSDISQLTPDRIENTMEELKDIATSVMWEPSHITDDIFSEKDTAYKILQRNSKPNVKLWTTVPKCSETPVFSSVLLWAKQIGNAAKTGYDVVFRQPRMHELFTDTPVYWFSLLHKKLMGSNVLDAKITSNRAGTSIFAHCTRKQNSFVRRGALTVMIMNENQETCSIKVKIGPAFPEKSMEVQSYILTSPEMNSTQVLLNGKLLTIEMLQEKNPFEPKVRRAKTPSYIMLSLPAMSVGFFVLPGARVPVCIDQETETKLLLEEMEENQNIPLPEEVALTFSPRDSFVKNHFLDDITKKMKEEMMSDEKYYSHTSLKSRLEDPKDKKSTKEGKIDERGRKFFIDRVKLADKHKKHNDFEKRREELKKFLLERSKWSKAEPKLESKVRELELTSGEVERILKDRARARAARRNIVFTDEELKALVHRASKKFYKSRIKRSIPPANRAKRDINVRLLERTIQLHPSCEKLLEDHEHGHLDETNEQISKNIFVRKPRDINMKLGDFKTKLADTKNKWEDKRDEILGNTQMARENIKDRIRKLKNRNRIRRDINMELLEVKSKPGKKSEPGKKRLKKKMEMAATMREPGQTSAELLEELEFEEGRQNNDHRVKPKTEIYAELADSEDLEEEEFFKPTPKSKKLKLFDKKAKLDPFAITNPSIEIVEPPFRKSKKEKKKKSKSRSDNLQFLTSSEEFTDVEDDLPCIHEYFGPESKSEKRQKSVITELGEMTTEEKSKRKKNKKMKKNSEDTSSEEGLRRRKRDAYLQPYNPNEFTEPIDRLKYFESILDKIDLKCEECAKQRKKASDVRGAVEGDRKTTSQQRGLYLRKQPQEPTDSYSDRLNKLGTMLDNLEAKYKACISEKTEQTDDTSSHFTGRPLNGEKEFPTITHRNVDNITRQKRSNSPSVEPDVISVEDDFKDYKKDMKKHLKDLKQLLENDKVKFQEKKRKNKMRLLQLKKKQELELAKEAVEVVSKVQKNETESGLDLLEHLRRIKEDLQHKKDNLDKLMMQDLKNQNEENGGKSKLESEPSLGEHKVMTKKSKDGKTYERNPKTIKSNPNELPKPHGNSRNMFDKAPVEVKMVKRSIFDGKNVFGNYLPVTPELRMWKPADILSLKKDFNPFHTNNLLPPNDLHIFKNIFDQNSLLNLRKRRSIDSNMDNLENEIDTDINEIKKESQHIWPHKNSESGDLKFVLPNRDEFEIQENEGVTEIKFLHHDDNKISKHYAATDDSFELLKDDSAEEMAHSEEDMSNANTMMKNRKKGDIGDFTRNNEPKDSGVNEDSLFSDFFTYHHPLRDMAKKSSFRHHMIPVQSKEDDFIDLLRNSKPKDIEVTEDSLLSLLFDGNPTKELKRKNQQPTEDDDMKHEAKGDIQDRVTYDREKDVGILGYKVTKVDGVTDNSGRIKSSDISEEERKNITTYNQSRFANVQKIPMKQEQRMFEDLINNLTNFFSKINTQIQTYVKKIIN